MRDIETREDIDELVADFYRKALADDKIGYLFTEIAEINLEHHLPIIADFWEMMLFGTVNFQAKYKRSPMHVHQILSEKEPLRAEHFGRWVRLFCETVDGKFAGEKANLAKARAFSIAETMRLKFSAKTSAGVPLVRE